MEDPIQAGAAFFDYDGDGRPDVFLTSAGGPNALYRNNGDGTFSDVTARAGLDDPDGITIGGRMCRFQQQRATATCS